MFFFLRRRWKNHLVEILQPPETHMDPNKMIRLGRGVFLPTMEDVFLGLPCYFPCYLLGCPKKLGSMVRISGFLGGGFKYFSFSPLLREDSHFD